MTTPAIAEPVQTAQDVGGAGELCEATAHCIERQPFRAIGVTFASGLILGLLIGRIQLRRLWRALWNV